MHVWTRKLVNLGFGGLQLNSQTQRDYLNRIELGCRLASSINGPLTPKPTPKWLALTESRRSPVLTANVLRLSKGIRMQPAVSNGTQQQGVSATEITSPAANWKPASLGVSSNNRNKAEFRSSETGVRANPPERLLPHNKMPLHGRWIVYSASASFGTTIFPCLPTVDPP